MPLFELGLVLEPKVTVLHVFDEANSIVVFRESGMTFIDILVSNQVQLDEASDL